MSSNDPRIEVDVRLGAAGENIRRFLAPALLDVGDLGVLDAELRPSTPLSASTSRPRLSVRRRQQLDATTISTESIAAP